MDRKTKSSQQSKILFYPRLKYVVMSQSALESSSSARSKEKQKQTFKIL